MKLFGRRRRMSHASSTQTLPNFVSASNTSEETIAPFSSLSDGQVQRNSDRRFIHGSFTEDKGVGVDFDNIGVLYTPAASVSTEANPPAEIPSDSNSEADIPFSKDVGTCTTTDSLQGVRNGTTYDCRPTRNSLPRKRDAAKSMLKKDMATSITMSDRDSLSPRRNYQISRDSSPTGNILIPRHVEPFRRGTETSFSFPPKTSLLSRKDAATSTSFPQNSLSPRKDVEVCVSSPPKRTLSLGKDAETSYSSSQNNPVSPRKDAETSTSFPQSSLSLRKDVELSVSSPPKSTLSLGKDAETSYSYPDNSSLSLGRGAETSFSSSQNNPVSPRKDAETSTSFPQNNSRSPLEDGVTSSSIPLNSSLSLGKVAETPFSSSQNRSLSPRKDSEISSSALMKSSLSPRKDSSAWLSQPMILTPPQEDAYKSELRSPRRSLKTQGSMEREPIIPTSPQKESELRSPRRSWDTRGLMERAPMIPTSPRKDTYKSELRREFSSPRRYLDTQGLMDREMEVAAQSSFSLTEGSAGSFGQWVQVDPNELAVRLSLMTWLAQPPSPTPATVVNRSTVATQTEVEVNLPEVPVVPDNDVFCILGKKIKPTTKPSQRCRVPTIDPKSYPRQLKPKKTTSPYALGINNDKMRHNKPLRKNIQFEARIHKDQMVLIQNPWGPGRNCNGNCQVVIRPADPDCEGNYITVISPNPNDKPPMNFTTTYGSDYQGNS